MPIKPLSRSFGRHLRALRIKRDLSQEKLGMRARLSRNFIGEIERGERNVTLETLEKLARALGVDRSELTRF